jgi:hypothetical protein
MEAICKMQTAENGEIRLQWPEELWGQQVEIKAKPTTTA